MYNRCTISIIEIYQIIYNILEGIDMSNKFFLKKSWINLDVCVEDYYNSGTTLEQAKENLNWSPYSTIVGRTAKLSRHTVEEIDEETYKTKIKKSNSKTLDEKAISIKDTTE